MPKYLVHFPFLFLLLTAITGVWMRLFPILNHIQIIPYDHILHGHSHVAVLGWTFLAVLVLYLKVTWEHLIHQKQAIVLVFITFITTCMMFIAFLWQGYALYSIILSTVHILVEYWAIVFVYRSLKTVPNMPKISKWFINGSLITLFVSSIGPWSLGAIASQGLQSTPLFDMAIYFYLHFQYNGWLYLILIGLIIYIFSKKGIVLHTTLLQISFWVYIGALFPGYILSVLWYDFGIIGIVLATIGAIGQLIGVILFCLAIYRSKEKLSTYFSKQINILIGFIGFLLLSKSFMELALIHLPFATLIYETRSVIVGYLHLTFLGFISLVIIMLFQMEKLLQEKSRFVILGIILFLFGFLINEFILFLSGLMSWISNTDIWYQNEILLLASFLLASGILLLWINVFNEHKSSPS